MCASRLLLANCVSAASVGGVRARSAEEANSVDVHEYVIKVRTVKQVNYASLHEYAVPARRVVAADSVSMELAEELWWRQYLAP